MSPATGKVVKCNPHPNVTWSMRTGNCSVLLWLTLRLTLNSKLLEQLNAATKLKTYIKVYHDRMQINKIQHIENIIFLSVFQNCEVDELKNKTQSNAVYQGLEQIFFTLFCQYLLYLLHLDTPVKPNYFQLVQIQASKARIMGVKIPSIRELSLGLRMERSQQAIQDLTNMFKGHKVSINAWGGGKQHNFRL